SAQEKRGVKTAPLQSAAETGRLLRSRKRALRGVFPIGRRPLKRIPAQLRHKSIEDACGIARRKRGVFPESKKPLTLLGKTALGKERSNLAAGLPAIRLSAGEWRRLNLAMPGNSARASSPSLSDRPRRAR